MMSQGRCGNLTFFYERTKNGDYQIMVRGKHASHAAIVFSYDQIPDMVRELHEKIEVEDLRREQYRYEHMTYREFMEEQKRTEDKGFNPFARRFKTDVFGNPIPDVRHPSSIPDNRTEDFSNNPSPRDGDVFIWKGKRSPGDPPPNQFLQDRHVLRSERFEKRTRVVPRVEFFRTDDATPNDASIRTETYDWCEVVFTNKPENGFDGGLRWAQRGEYHRSSTDMTWGTAPAASAPRSQEEDDEPLVAYTMCSRRRQGQCSQCGTKDLGFAHETPEGVYVTGEEADYCKKCKTFGPRVLVDWEPKPNGKYKAHYCGEKQKANGEHPRDVPGETEADGDGESGGLGDEPETEPDNQAGDLDLKPKSELNEDGTPKQKDEKPDPKAGDAKDSDVDPWTGEAYEIPKFKPKLPPRPGSEGGGQDASDGAPQMPEAAQQPPPEAPEAPQFQSPQNQEGDGESDSDSDEPDYVTHPELDERSNEISEQVLKLATDYTKEYTDVVGRNIVSHVETRFAHVMEVGARNAKQFREEMERNVTRSRKYTDERIAEAIGNGFGGGKGETHFIKIGDKPKKALPELHHRTLPTLISMLAGGEHVGMVGTAAAGKGKLARQAAEALGRKFYALPGSLSPQTTVSQIMGYMNANGNYVRTLYRDAFEHGGVMFFDELDNAHPAAMASVNDGLAIQAGDEIAFPDGMVKRHPDFIVVAAMNTWGRGPDQLYAARQRGDAATWDRLALLAVEIDAQLEMTLCHRTGADTRIVGEVNRYIRALRKRAATEFPSQPILLSMRASIGLCKLLAAGVDDETAVDVRVRRGMSDQDWAKLTSGIRPLEVML